MTNATNNVSGMLMSPQNPNSLSLGKAKEEPVLNTSFVSVFNNTVDSMSVSGSTDSKKELPLREVTAAESYESSSKTTVKDNPKTEAKPEETGKEELGQKLEKAGEEIKEAVTSELDISKEDLEKAMEILGLAAMDLVDPKNLAMLLSQLTETENPISLVLNDSINSILKQATEIINQFTSDNEISFDEVRNYLEGFEAVEPETFEEQLKATAETFAEAENAPVEITHDAVEVSEEISVKSEIRTEKPEVISKSDKPETEVTEVKAAEVEEKTTDENKDDSFNSSKDSDDSKNAFENSKVDSENTFKTGKSDNDRIRDSFNESTTQVSEAKLTFEPKTQTVELPTGESVRVQELIDQVVEQAKFINTTEKATIEMTLNPEGLGKVFVEVTQKGDEIIAKLHAQNEAVKQALESQMANLKLEVNNSATKITSVEVSVGTHEFERNLEEGQQNSNGQQNENQSGRNQKRTRIDLNNLDELTGLMSEEERLVAQIMKDNGNSLNYQV